MHVLTYDQRWGAVPALLALLNDEATHLVTREQLRALESTESDAAGAMLYVVVAVIAVQRYDEK